MLITGDALRVVSDDHHPLSAVPGLLSLQHWKGYTVGYRVPLALSHDVQAAFRASEQPARVAAALDALAEETPAA